MKLQSAFDFTGSVKYGVKLGSPTIDGSLFVWDHDNFPDGTIEEDGSVTLTVPTPYDPVALFGGS